jgi:hypothetical protein
MQLFLRVIALVYVAALTLFFAVYRRAVRHSDSRPLSLLPRRNNVIPFRPRSSRRKDPPAPDVESVNNFR